MLEPEPGWQLGLGRLECSVRAYRLEQLLDQLLQSGSEEFGDSVSALGSALASAEALAAAYSEQQPLEGGPLHHD